MIDSESEDKDRRDEMKENARCADVDGKRERERERDGKEDKA